MSSISSAPNGSRRDVVLQLLKEIEVGIEAEDLGERAFNSLVLLLVDAVIAADDETLCAGQRGLQRLWGQYYRIENPSSQQFEKRGRVLGLIDVVHWALLRIIPASLLAQLTPDSTPRRLLENLKEQSGWQISNLAKTLATDEDETRRLMAKMGRCGLVVQRAIGGKRYWEITPRGTKALELTRP